MQSHWTSRPLTLAIFNTTLAYKKISIHILYPFLLISYQNIPCHLSHHLYSHLAHLIPSRAIACHSSHLYSHSLTALIMYLPPYPSSHLHTSINNAYQHIPLKQGRQKTRWVSEETHNLPPSSRGCQRESFSFFAMPRAISTRLHSPHSSVTILYHSKRHYSHPTNPLQSHRFITFSHTTSKKTSYKLYS